jgi:hypothetical protein
MKERTEREILRDLLANVRRRIFFKAARTGLVQATLIVLPIAGILIALNRRAGFDWSNSGIASLALAAVAAFALIKGALTLGQKLHSALAIDEQGRLKDRISSAYEFLEESKLDEARTAQIQDAIRHGQSLELDRIFRFEWPRLSGFLPLILVLFALSFFVPPNAVSVSALVGVDKTKAAQLDQLKELEQQLQAQQQDKDLEEVLKKLQDIQKRFEKGELSDRDVMLQLARLDENLKQRTSDLGVDNLEKEMNMLIPHLMSSAATTEVAAAIKEDQLDKASEELQKLADKVKQDKLSKEQKRELAMNLGVCASKLGGKENGSFGGDFAKATESLEKSDNEGFQSSCKSMGDKLGLMKKARTMKLASQKVGNCKSCLGQCDSQELGYTLGPKQDGKSKGGLKAGTAASGDPLGEANRLADSYRKMMQVSGQAGDGPIESETEVTEGQLSRSQVNLKEVHANYAAVAEEAIEKENIPLSHRYHVKRYFQTIRPSE